MSAVILAIPAPLLFDVITRASQGNTWKYAASVWVSLGLLVLVHRMNVAMKVLAVGTIVIMSVLNDTRGIIAMAATGVLVEILSRTGRTRVYRIAASLIGASVLAVASYQLAIAGALGSGIQRTMILQTQEGPMSLLRTARPESGGNFALVLSDPFRFIIDDRVTADQAAVIQNSFSQVGRDPNSLYVQSGVLKSAELHSVTADLWLHLGFAGLLLSVIFGLFFAYLGFRALSSHRMLAGAVTFVSLRGVWDLLFSPVSDLRFWPLYFLVGLAFLASERKLRASTG
ncbi:hypothetical protein J2X12_000614 [Pseudarthrobacter oxydans]|uniref:Uncharacterized protein n=1 Tax=Pseudarthrobacter oxydans TaxID=1671 RepID=A0AAW8N4D5_PSEOX|nr:hypothetical protein [Pseudarthrobacter oxydans]